MTAAAVASGWRPLDHAFARQMLGKWLARAGRHRAAPLIDQAGRDIVLTRSAATVAPGAQGHLRRLRSYGGLVNMPGCR
ncbi:hypothetical protein MES5069_450003 [Mesorhizobium escarrei]|uniref:Uncharacterized protein n=1 Tax=Mesorhizobium escarrei TaxID=666018 RepID=A0ABM9E7A3_9HYPH|nr:hypothetical protein MES5069_450003 [Mesorhizobium escarrei]